MLASEFFWLTFLCVTVSVISGEMRPKFSVAHHQNHHHENGGPGCWGNGPGRGPPLSTPRTPPPPPPEDNPDFGNDGEVGDDGEFGDDEEFGNDDDLANDEVENGDEKERIKIRQGEPPKLKSNKSPHQK